MNNIVPPLLPIHAVSAYIHSMQHRPPAAVQPSKPKATDTMKGVKDVEGPSPVVRQSESRMSRGTGAE